MRPPSMTMMRSHICRIASRCVAMDTQSERLFIEALDRAVARSQTLIIATHREAILQMCDRIIVIDGGRIVADGPRAEILARTSREAAS